MRARPPLPSPGPTLEVLQAGRKPQFLIFFSLEEEEEGEGRGRRGRKRKKRERRDGRGSYFFYVFIFFNLY